MREILITFFVVTLLFFSCKNIQKNKNIGKDDADNNIAVDTSIANSSAYEREQRFIERKRKLVKELSLYDLENGTDDYELRVWKRGFYEPSILYVLKFGDSVWTLRHYQFYATSDNINEKPPLIDSIIMGTVKPQKMNWTDYIKQLNLDSLWVLKSESAIRDKSFEVLDGWIWLLEISKKKQYKYYYYTVPEMYKDKEINHKKFADFLKRLVDPIVYRGLVNP